MTEHPNTPLAGIAGDAGSPLRRRREGRLVAGVAAGLADYLGLDAAVVRLGLVALSFLGGAGVPLYAAAWLLVPEEGAPSSVAADLAHRRVA